MLKGSRDLEKILTPIVVAAVALIDPGGRVLMQQRRFTAVHGGLWEFPGGKVEAGETTVSGAVREMKEELGVLIEPEALTAVGCAQGQAAPNPAHPEQQRPLVIHLYACRSWVGSPQAYDAEAIAWIRPQAIGALAMPPLDYPLADALCRHLRTD